MNVLATVLGLLAVAMFVASYQLKSGRAIIFFNAGSRVLYVIQYILLGAPFWLVYNMLSAAYGSALGNVITLVSITVAIIRYGVLKKEKADIATETCNLV